MDIDAQDGLEGAGDSTIQASPPASSENLGPVNSVEVPIIPL